MSTRAKLIIAAVVGVLCIAGLASQLVNRGSVTSYVADNFQTVANSAVPGSRESTKTYVSNKSPLDTANQIAGAWKPAQRDDTGSGSFLRYSDHIVGVTPGPNNGAYVSVDNDRDGYARWFPFVGGFWGTSTGAGETFRGGGPGAGK